MNLKKYLPFIVVGAVAIIFIAGVFIIRRNNNKTTTSDIQDDSQPVAEIPADQRPTLYLIPGVDGHTLNLKVDDIKVHGATSLEYEMTWTANNTGTPSTQGTSGTIQLNGQRSIERKDLLLGSESSGKKRYDKGVEIGKLIFRFRDTNGKLLGRLSSDWHLQNSTLALTSADGSFKYTLDKIALSTWFVTIQPFGTPTGANLVIFSNNWAIYSSDGIPHSGK